jgi:hypothetical protein
MKYAYTIIALLIVVPLLLVAFHRSQKEAFGASQGGAQIQLATSHVASEEEVAANYEYNKRRVSQDILDMTEPERYGTPVPAQHWK